MKGFQQTTQYRNILRKITLLLYREKVGMRGREYVKNQQRHWGSNPRQR